MRSVLGVFHYQPTIRSSAMSYIPQKHPDLDRMTQIWSKRSPEELKELAHTKRFLECVTGDEEFRTKLAEHIERPIVLAKEHGIDIDPDLLRPLFQREYLAYRFESGNDRWPLAQKWDQYLREMIAGRDGLLTVGDTEVENPRFHKWRRRQIARVRSELGHGASGIVHPVICYEISKGCTVGCWFCGISAEKFAGYLPYTPENERLWRGMLKGVVQRFGAASQTGFCYWATDPSDNPDYAKFIQAHYEVTGVMPQTTTAAPLKNLPLTREVLSLFDKHRCIVNRFSILSVGQLRRVHKTFTPEELLGCELVLQNSGALTTKSTAGRALERRKKHDGASSDAAVGSSNIARHPTGIPDQADGTIACISGFLVKLMERKIELVTPTRAGKRWPDGYRILGSEEFADDEQFGKAIDRLIERCMPESLAGGDRLAFREDLTFETIDYGFRLSNDRGVSEVRGAPWMSLAGTLIQSGDKTTAQVIAEVVPTSGDIIGISIFLNELYQAGVLDDDPVYGGCGRPLPARAPRAEGLEARSSA